MSDVLTGGELVVRSLAAHGVELVFGIPGTHNLPLYAQLDRHGVRHVSPRHEQGAGYAADGYARASGRPGVVVTTAGPALMNVGGGGGAGAVGLRPAARRLAGDAARPPDGVDRLPARDAQPAAGVLGRRGAQRARDEPRRARARARRRVRRVPVAAPARPLHRGPARPARRGRRRGRAGGARRRPGRGAGGRDRRGGRAAARRRASRRDRRRRRRRRRGRARRARRAARRARDHHGQRQGHDPGPASARARRAPQPGGGARVARGLRRRPGGRHRARRVRPLGTAAGAVAASSCASTSTPSRRTPTTSLPSR